MAASALNLTVTELHCFALLCIALHCFALLLNRPLT